MNGDAGETGDIYAKLRQKLIDWLDDNYLFGDAESMISSDDLSWLENSILDSLGFVQLILFLEQSFSIELDRKDIRRENFDGMRKIIDYVMKHPQFNGV